MLSFIRRERDNDEIIKDLSQFKRKEVVSKDKRIVFPIQDSYQLPSVRKIAQYCEMKKPEIKCR